jgi:hypothetical protein
VTDELTYIGRYKQFVARASVEKLLSIALYTELSASNLGHKGRLSLFTSSAHMDFGLPCRLVPQGLAIKIAIVMGLSVF